MPARLISPFKIRCLFISMILLIWNIESVIAVEPVYVWEVVSTYRRRLNEGRIQLLPDGKTDAGIDWEIKGNKIDFGTEGEAEPRINGAFFKGNWIGGWHLNARVLMSHTSLETEPGTVVEIPAEGGQSLVGTKFSKDLEKSIYDLWEFLAFKRGTNQFIHLTCLLTPDRQILDGTRRIGTYELMRGKMVAKFLDPKFQEIEFKLQRNGSLASRIKADDGKYWDLVFTRVQRQAVFQT